MIDDGYAFSLLLLQLSVHAGGWGASDSSQGGTLLSFRCGLHADGSAAYYS
jgi:hypothetical protein